MTVNFMDVYNVEHLEGKRVGEFEAELEDGSWGLMKLEVSEEPHEILPNVYNLAFGPVDGWGKINTHARMRYRYRMKVFSTVLLFMENYLRAYPGCKLGIDGSSNSRAELYYRGWQRHFVYLNAYMQMEGVKFYVRILRTGKNQLDDPFDFEDVEHNKYLIGRSGAPDKNVMYNYFIVSKK
ncbi:DUF6934 family protein [Chitinophaga sp. GCM10012297]|uniref:Uncharacterized protein n=1 Tax=Chitinophaga chungangae TaxID=2821488 RepID=A0ABS3YAG9_9BACT|nr:hypothetical protein [Chitinophaga chungangae]MBO9151667.1 hypothetical protein [Chitinophaga chungangae]